jgi:hypothetical protein
MYILVHIYVSYALLNNIFTNLVDKISRRTGLTTSLMYFCS